MKKQIIVSDYCSIVKTIFSDITSHGFDLSTVGFFMVSFLMED